MLRDFAIGAVWLFALVAALAFFEDGLGIALLASAAVAVAVSLVDGGL